MLQIKAQTPPYTYIPDAQNWDCGFSPAKMNQLSADTGFMNSMARYNSNINNPLLKAFPVPAGPYIVPVVFHLIDATTPTIPYAQIQWQMARLNAAFANQMNLFNGQANSPHGVNTQIEFRLACVAQNSLSAWTSSVEPGVMRYATTNTVVLNQGVAPSATTADLLAITHPTAFPTTFPFANYLNIWCVPNIGPGNVAGYGTFPVGTFGGIDGIVMRLEMIGNNSYPTNFNMFSQLDKGSILAHEVGHYLGLYHTFESMPALSGVLGCYGTTPTDATTDGDLLLDTPPTMYAQDLGSILSVNSCTETNFPYSAAIDENDQLENYMCYSDDDKLNAFTQDQADRMVDNFNTIGNLRFTLNDPANLTATGVDPNSCTNNSGLLTAIFNYSLEPGATCTSSVIKFTNPQSLGFTATSWNWSFGDGTTGTGASPTHTYSTASGTLFIAMCSASDGTTTVTYSTSISISFDVFISGQSGLNMPVCKGSEQTIYITFGIGIPSAVLTDGTNQIVVNNYMNSTNPTFGTKIIPYTFVINNSATYNLVPASCGTINLGSATFSVIECCNNSITNGDFSAGNTGFNTDLSFGPAPGLPNPTYYGTYIVDTPGSLTAWIPTMGTNLMNVTGNALNVDGFSGNNGIVNIASTTFSPCTPSAQTPIIWQQTITGLRPSTTYYYSFKITENYFPFQSSNSCVQMNFATSITYSTSSFALPTQTLIPVPHVMGAPTNAFNYVVYTYTFNTPATTSTATPFSIQINQVNTFLGAFFDYFIDNITLNEMTSGVQAIGSNTICSSQTTTLSAIANCNNSLANYNYVWSPAAGLSSSTVMSPVAHPTTTTIYTLIASPTTTVGGLSAVISTVTVTVIPSINIPVNSPSICIGQGYTLTATGASNYSWSPGGATTSTIVVTPTVTSIYTVSTTNTVVGCPSSVTATINVSPPTVISPTAVAICLGNNTTLTGSGANTYSWSTGQTTSSITVSPTVTSNYTVIGTNTITGCTNTRTVTVTVNPNPTVTAVANPTSICVGQTATLTAGGATTYSWSTGANTSTTSINPTVTTTYTAYGFYATGCSSTKTVSVLVGPTTPTLSVNSPSFNTCGATSATLIASGAANYTWMPGSVTSATAVVTSTTATIYTVTGNYGVGCGVGTKTVLVSPVSSVCCSAATGTIGTSLTSTVYPAAGSFTNTSAIYNVQGVVTFTGNTSYNGFTFRMAPGALLRVDPNKTLTLTNCKMFSCTELWDGILLREDDLNFGNLVLNNTTIEDMYNGIVVDYDNHTINSSSPSGSITINASKLNKNYVSIQMRNCPGMSNGSSDYPFSITSSTISSATSTTSPGSSLKPSSISTYTYAYNTITNGSTGASAPYVNFPRSFTGIMLANLSYSCPVVIGSRNSSTLTNTFNNLDFGVNGTEVYTKVYNNYFKNITGSVKSLDISPLGPPPAQGPDEIGIAICITQTTTANRNSCYVGANSSLPSITNPYPDGNLFEDCNRGVKVTNNRYVTILGNVFTTTTTSIPVSTSSGYPPMFVINPNTYYYYTGQNAVWSSALGTKADLSYNLISNHNTGIYDSHSINPTISGTVIVQGNDISAPASTGYCKQAIQIDQAGGTNIPTDQAYIFNNRLINVYRGVVSNGVLSGLLIKGNTINVEGVAKTLNYTAASQRTGVALTSCQYASIKGNSFTQTGSMPTTTVTALAINGVYLKNSPYGKTECNTATNLGRCFVFEGTCDNSWKVNAMSNSYTGLEIRVLGRIGQQGASSGSPGNPNLSANTWTTMTRHTNILSSAGNNTISPLYVLSGASTTPTLNFGTAGHTYTIAAGLGIRTQTAGTSYTCSSGSAQRTSSGNNTANNSNMKTSEAQDSLTDYISLANSDENTYDVFTDEFLYQNKQLVYKLLDADSLNVADGSTLDNFYDANHKTALAQLTQVQQAIANDDISAANLANASVSPSNQVEYKHQRANELVLKYLTDRFYVYTDAEKQDLYSYANECVIKGYYVVQARNMINIITNQILNYNDDCEAEANAQRKAKVQATGVSSYSSFNLFPNPNSGNMQLDYNLGGFTKAEFKLYDITGKLISSKTIAENEGTLIINEQNLHNGVYFYHILVGEKTIKTDKIVIIK